MWDLRLSQRLLRTMLSFCIRRRVVWYKITSPSSEKLISLNIYQTARHNIPEHCVHLTPLYSSRVLIYRYHKQILSYHRFILRQFTLSNNHKTPFCYTTLSPQPLFAYPDDVTPVYPLCGIYEKQAPWHTAGRNTPADAAIDPRKPTFYRLALHHHHRDATPSWFRGSPR